MFCTKCGANTKGETSSFCTKCGAPFSSEPIATPAKSKKNIFKNKLFLGLAAIVVLFILVLVIIKQQPKKINVEDFIKISYSGYDEYATASAYLDKDKLYNAIIKVKGIKEKSLDDIESFEDLFDSKAFSNYYQLIDCMDSIELDISPNKNLSNGDNIIVDISYDNKIAKKQKIKFTGKSVSKEVKGLDAITKIDPFKDLNVSFSGLSPNGYLDYSYEGDNSYVSTYLFTSDNSTNLRNGDVVTISISYNDETTLSKGYILTEKEKQYVVEGLDEYVVDYADLPSYFLEDLKTDTQDMIYAYVASSYSKGFSLNDLSYSGYVFNTSKSESSSIFNSFNELSIIYSGLVSNTDGKISTTRVYFPVKYSDIIKSGEDIDFRFKSNVLGSSAFNNSWSYYTNGYINPFICYTELVESNRNVFIPSCGDGFEHYSENTPITSISQINETYRNELANEAKKLIENYVTKYNTENHIEALSLKGEYFLQAKSQGTDYVKNNKYIIVYSAMLYNNNGKFDATEVYYPVEYDGILSLPNDEYMVIQSKGIQGSTYIGSTWYKTDGYIDEEEMFNKLIVANRDLYTYEVSEGLNEFGE
jgi:hypothetical protein